MYGTLYEDCTFPCPSQATETITSLTNIDGIGVLCDRCYDRGGPKEVTVAVTSSVDNATVAVGVGNAHGPSSSVAKPTDEEELEPAVPVPRMGSSELSTSRKIRKLDDAKSNTSTSLVIPKSGGENMDAGVKVGYYNANFKLAALASVTKPGRVNSYTIDKWLEECKDDVVNAIWDQGLHVVCLVGMCPYNSDPNKLLPQWLERYHHEHAKGVLHYFVHDIPGTWDVYSVGSYGVIISRSSVEMLVAPKVVDVARRTLLLEIARLVV